MSGGYSFSQVPMADIPRSVFNRTHGHKTTFDAGKLIPFFVDEALPGDTFNVNASLFARLATPIVPFMDNLYLDVFWFAVPNRLVWDNWQKFCGEQEEPGDSTDYHIPTITSGVAGFAPGSIFDYMGLPLNIGDLQVNALPFRAYNLIFNEWFRDENLVNRVTVYKGDVTEDAGNYNLMSRGKRHDYFTSCLPWPQKGPGVNLSLGGTIPVTITGSPTQPPNFYHQGGGGIGPLSVTSEVTNPGAVYQASAGAQGATLMWNQPNLLGVGDLSNATAVTINNLRQAFQVQKMLERDARGGTRYVELLKSHFGVTAPDFRLQRPEYLGGGSIRVHVNPVTQTSETGDATPQGNLAAYGTAGGRIGFTKAFVEHSYIIGLVMCRADLSYQQGLPRMFTRRTRFDFYWPAFAHLGEQAVLNQEIYCQAPNQIDPETGTSYNLGVFGYQERWAEYRYYPSKITGKFRRTATLDPNSLDAWHLAQFFTSLPKLNAAFITEDPPVDRVIAVTSEPHFLFDSHIQMKCTRPMPTYSVPGLTDHF